MQTEAEAGAMRPQARSHRGLPGTAPSKDAPLRREHGPADTAIRGFQPLGL